MKEKKKEEKGIESKNIFKILIHMNVWHWQCLCYAWYDVLSHKIKFRNRNSHEITESSRFDRKHKQKYMSNMLFPYECSLVENKSDSQKFLTSTLSPNTDLFWDPGNLPDHCDFISSSVKLAEYLPKSQMLGDLINVSVCVKMKCCLPTKCQVIQIFCSHFLQTP